MKASLKFNLPDEEQALQLAIDGHKWKAVIEEVDQNLRNKAKYEDLTEVTIEDVRTLITATIISWGLSE